MRVHFIAIGGSAMHNLAIALHKKGYSITGSDDEIFEPSKSRLAACNILPSSQGWDASRITPDLDAVIVGMHAKSDNPELLKAKKLGIKIVGWVIVLAILAAPALYYFRREPVVRVTAATLKKGRVEQTITAMASGTVKPKIDSMVAATARVGAGTSPAIARSSIFFRSRVAAASRAADHRS